MKVELFIKKEDVPIIDKIISISEIDQEYKCNNSDTLDQIDNTLKSLTDLKETLKNYEDGTEINKDIEDKCASLIDNCEKLKNYLNDFDLSDKIQKEKENFKENKIGSVFIKALEDINIEKEIEKRIIYKGKYYSLNTLDENYNDNATKVTWKVGNTNYSVYVAKLEYGDDAGYHQTPLIYNNDLVLNIGETVTSLLDKLKNMLGDFEYFYDLNGRFIFQKKKTYLQELFSPINGDIVTPIMEAS